MRRIAANLARFLVATAYLAVLAWLVVDPVYQAPSGDLAEYLNNAYRVTLGEQPYLDFWLLFPPGEVFLPAAVLAAAGGNLNVVMAWNLLQSAVIAALFGALARRLRAPWWAAALTGILFLFSSALAIKAGGLCYGHSYLLLLGV
ncbi:hypothetical protein, partial [Guyparkeria sp.]|uniref:hypothetical protein n=1 Tax=Guyparkeria sp. TaxID=2035736 RepID=UPI003970AB81